MRRFATRCEQYERERLFTAVNSRRSEAEKLLTFEFARFLFDHGLNPLIDPKISGLKPDVIDVSLGRPIYVEAKQYSSQNPRTRILQGTWQTLDTWGRLRQAYDLDEAFLVVFRLGGPRLELPESVSVHGRRFYLVLVDLGPTEISGSRQRLNPITISAEEILRERPIRKPATTRSN